MATMRETFERSMQEMAREEREAMGALSDYYRNIIDRGKELEIEERIDGRGEAHIRAAVLQAARGGSVLMMAYTRRQAQDILLKALIIAGNNEYGTALNLDTLRLSFTTRGGQIKVMVTENEEKDTRRKQLELDVENAKRALKEYDERQAEPKVSDYRVVSGHVSITREANDNYVKVDLLLRDLEGNDTTYRLNESLYQFSPEELVMPHDVPRGTSDIARVIGRSRFLNNQQMFDGGITDQQPGK
jgi:hypothetical protein